MPGDAERDRCNGAGEKSERGKRIKRAGLDRRFPERQRTCGRNKEAGHREIVAAGAAQPDGLPSVDDLAIRNRKKQDARDGRPVFVKARLIAVEDPAAADQPCTVLASARK